MIKRFNPDFSLSISHELAYMRETPEGGYVEHGDYATLFSELELVKADRDALADKLARLEYNLGNALIGEQETIRRADALAVVWNVCELLKIRMPHAEKAFGVIIGRKGNKVREAK